MPERREIRVERMTRREFRDALNSEKIKAAIIPTGSIEQHLEHLAIEHDWRSVMHIADNVATRLRPQVLVAPSMRIGISEHHMRHIGTLTALPGSWLGVLFDTITSMHRAGFTNILVLNGHGGNISPCNGIWSQFLQRLEINLFFHSYWDFLSENVAHAHLKTGKYPGHAQEFETAFALAVFPENVRHDAMREQEDQAPLEATAEAGIAMIDSIVANITEFVSGMIGGTQVAEIPPFQA